MASSWFTPSLILATSLAALAQQPGVPPRFVALAREQDPGATAGFDAMQATVWSIDPLQRTAERRLVLGHSPWEPVPLFDSPSLLLWQVPIAEERWRLLHLDLTTFAAREVLRDDRLQPIGAHGDRSYVQTAAASVVLTEDGSKSERLPQRLQLLATSDRAWLIVADGELGRFDPARGKVMRTYERIPVKEDVANESVTRWDGGRYATNVGRFVDAENQPVPYLPYGRSAIVRREIAVWDLDEGTQRTFTVRLQALGGSGVGVIPMPMHSEVVGGLFRYAERKATDEPLGSLEAIDWVREVEWVTSDLATGKELLRVPFAPRVVTDPDQPPRERVPEWLREHFDASPIRAWGVTQDVAWAFLRHQAAEVPISGPGPTKLDAVARTVDGNRLLVLHRGTFSYCDLATRELRQWPAPEELRKANVSLHEAR